VLKVPGVPRVLNALVLTLTVPIVLLVLASPVYAQQPPAAPYVGQPVVSIAVSIEGHPATDTALLEAVQMKVGRPLQMSDVRETMTHLYTFGRFEDVQVDANNVPGGVAITILLEPIHVVTKVEFRGELGLSEGVLRDRMTERFSATPPAAKSAEVAAALEQIYRERGYMTATVTAAPPIVEHDPDRATLVFDVTAGPRMRIASAAVTGHPLESIEQVRARLHVTPGEPYQPGDLQTRLNDYIAWMRGRGYYQADARALDTRMNAERTQADITVDVQPGPLVTVEFTGDPLPRGKRDELVPIQREGAVDQDILEDAARRITDYLQQEGYWKAEVAPPERKEGNGQLAIVFDVRRGPLFHVAPEGVQVTGAQALPPESIRDYLKTLAPGDPFVVSKMNAIEGAIKQAYLERGYTAVEVLSQPNEAGPALVQPVIVVKEGPRVLVGRLTVTGNDKIDASKLLETAKIQTGEPYYGPAVVAARDRMVALYLDNGFQSADVVVPRPTPVADDGSAHADIEFQVSEGPQTRIDHIFISGNVRTKPDVIRRELAIVEGQPLGQQQLTRTRQNLSALGQFRRIQITSDSHGDPGRTDNIEAVEEAQQTSIDYGGGAQVERILRDTAGGSPNQVFEFAPRGFFEIGRRNMGGKNRSMNLYTRVGLRPHSNQEDTSLFGFPEYRVVGTYREPKAWRNYADLTGTAAIEQGVRTGFNFVRQGVNAELTRAISPRVRVSGQYAFTKTRTRDVQLTEEEQLNVDRVFPQVRLSTFSAAVSRDTRDDPVSPGHGTLLSADATIGPRALGSEIGFAKLFVQGFFYREFGRPNQVFAAGARLGVARAQQQIKNGELVEDLPASERFYAGGDTTVRGFARDSLGRPDTLTASGFPRGGEAEVILNAELRLPVKGDFGAVLFADSGNVFSRATNIDMTELRLALGFGARYRSYIGPIRIDFGFPVHRYVVGNQLEKRFQIHFSMGHAF
jgi:outer membrane protein assembly complex protein YaeT